MNSLQSMLKQHMKGEEQAQIETITAMHSNLIIKTAEVDELSTAIHALTKKMDDTRERAATICLSRLPIIFLDSSGCARARRQQPLGSARRERRATRGSDAGGD